MKFIHSLPLIALLSAPLHSATVVVALDGDPAPTFSFGNPGYSVTVAPTSLVVKAPDSGFGTVYNLPTLVSIIGALSNYSLEIDIRQDSGNTSTALSIGLGQGSDTGPLHFYNLPSPLTYPTTGFTTYTIADLSVPSFSQNPNGAPQALAANGIFSIRLGGSYNGQITNVTFSQIRLVQVPEPTSSLILGTIATLGLLRRRRAA